MERPEIFDAYNPPPSVELTAEEMGPSMTVQSETESTDVNKIVARFEVTHVLPVANRDGVFADVSGMTDFRAALEQVRVANDFFMSLPAAVRARFENDPAEFVDFVSNPANKPEMITLGLLPPEPAPEPLAVQVQARGADGKFVAAAEAVSKPA